MMTPGEAKLSPATYARTRMAPSGSWASLIILVLHPSFGVRSREIRGRECDNINTRSPPVQVEDGKDSHLGGLDRT